MLSSPPTHFRVRVADGVAIARIQSRAIRQPEQAVEFGEELGRLVDQDGHRRILLDFSDNAYLCSTALGVLISFARKAEGAGAQVKICRLDPSVRLVANIVRLPSVIPIYDDEREALDSF